MSVRVESDGMVWRLWATEHDAKAAAKKLEGHWHPVEHLSETGWFLEGPDRTWRDTGGFIRPDIINLHLQHVLYDQRALLRSLKWLAITNDDAKVTQLTDDLAKEIREKTKALTQLTVGKF